MTLSPIRQTTLLVLLLECVLITQSLAQMAEGMVLLNPGPVPKGARLRYGSGWMPRAEVPAMRRSMGVTHHEASALVPLFVDAQEDLVFTAGARGRSHRGDALVPDSLWDLSLGPAYRRKLNGDRMVGASLMVGSASDKPFASFSEVTGMVNGFYTWQGGPRSSWYVLFNWSNNRQFLNYIPLPGFAYAHESEDKRTRTVAGLPFLVLSHKATDRITLLFSYFVPTVTNASMSYRIVGPVQAYTGFSWANQRYLLHDRESPRQRLFVDEKRATLGVRSPVSQALFLDLSGGWSFDRRYFQSERFFSGRKSQLEIGAAPFISASLGASL